ncbi:hypothetical protein GHT06_014181 [Daphnia sinensis]|uniref:GH18 domain-containing protein n=1 Tax=Daphnia sinensis TaxID=1820382 RepID=A0AAD5LCH7_9CRUS|nr:hypothetical protein GHT06_014181 [Daphnia sinensis]
MVCLSRLVGFTLILFAFTANGVQTGGPLLACHVPLEVKIFADSSYQALSADLKPCTHIILSSVNALFLPTSNASLASILVNEKRSLELLKQQTPEAEFSFSLRSTNTVPATWNLKTIFNRTSSIPLLVEFLRVNKLKSFDIAWDLIQSTQDYGPQLKSLKATLGKEGFNLTTTIGVEVDRIDAFHVTKIASIVDRIFLVSSYNRHYSGSRYPLTEKKVEQAFDALELNEGTFLKLYSTLNLSWKKIVVGLSLKTLVWKLNIGTIMGTQFNQYQAVLQLQSYYESCKTVNSSWRIQHQSPSPFYQLALAPTNDQWMIHVDPLTLGRRVDLLKQYGFGGDDFAGICNPKVKIYPIIEQAGRSIRNVNVTVPFPNIDVNNGFCIPFLGLTNECKGAFNLGTPNISTKSLEFTTPSTVPVTRTTFPVANNTTPTRESSQYVAETGVTMPSSSTSGATIDLAPSWAQVADAENLVRTRRSSVSSSDMGTEPSYSYLRPPGFDLVDIAPSFSSSNSEFGLPAPKSLTNVTPNIVREASEGKIDPSRDHPTYLSDVVATMISQTLELPGTAGNQAVLAIQEPTQSAADIVSSKLLSWKLEIPTAVPPVSTSLPGLDTFTEIEPRSVTALQNSIENGAPVASVTPTSEVDRMTDSTIVSTVSSSQATITSSFQIEVESSSKFDLQVEATTDVTTYASDSTENTVLSSKAELDLHHSSTTTPQVAIDQEPTASSQYSGSVGDPVEQVTPELSTLLTDNYQESSTDAPMNSAKFDVTDLKYETPVLQEVVTPSVQEVKNDDESTSAIEISTEYPSSTLPSKALFSTTATDTSVSDVFSSISSLAFDLVDPSSTATSTEEQERLVSSASLVSEEDEPPTSNINFSTMYVTPIALEVDGEMESEKIASSNNTFSIQEGNAPEETFSSETPLIHSTVYDPSSVKDSLPEHPGMAGKTEDPSTVVDDVSPTKEVASVFEESVESSLPSQIFFSNVEPIFPLNLMDVDSTSSIPDTTETSPELSSSGPSSSMTPIEETSFSILLDFSTSETPTLLDVSTAAIESTDQNSGTSKEDQDPLFGQSQSEMTSAIDLNENQYTEPFQEASSDEPAVPFHTTTIDVEMTDISTGDEVNLPADSIQPSSNEKISTIEFSPTTLQISTESSFPTSDFEGISSTTESISSFTVADTSTYLKPNIMESSTEERYYDSSLSDLKAAAEEVLSSNDLSTPDASTVADITSTENNPSSSLELADSEVSSSVADWNSPEVFTESGLLSSTSNSIEMMNVQTVGNKEIAALSSTSLSEEFGISKLSSISMETSTEDNFSLSSNEVSPTFEPIPHSSVEDTSSTLLFNIGDLSTTNSPSVPDDITARTRLVHEENEFVSSTVNSLYLEDSQTNFPSDKVDSSLVSFAVEENNIDTTLYADMSEATESVPVSTEEDSSHTVMKEHLSSTIYASLEQTPATLEENPPELTTESSTSGSVPVSADPSLLHSTPMEIKSSSIEVTPSNEEFAVVELSPTDTGTSTDGSSLISDEFSGTSELPSNFVDTSPVEFSMGHLNFLSENSVTFEEFAQTITAEEFQTLPISEEATTSTTVLMDEEDDRFTSKTILYSEDLQSNVPTEKTHSSDFPFEMSGSFEETLDLLETNPSLTDSPASFQPFSTSNELSGDFTSFEPSLSTTSPTEVQNLEPDLTTSVEELIEVSTPTPNFENEGLEDNSFLTLDEDGSGTPGFLIPTDQPHETVSPINLLPSSLIDTHLELVEDSFTSTLTSTQIADTSKSSTVSDISSKDVTFEGSTSLPIAVSFESIADATTFPSEPALELSTSSVLPLDYDVTVTSTTVWDNIFPEGSGDSLGSSSPLEDSFTDPSLPNLEATSTPEDGEGSAVSAITSSNEQFDISKSSPSILEVSTEGVTLMTDEFSGASELPHNHKGTSTFFTELSTDHLNSENSLTFSPNIQTLIEEKLSSSFLPTTSGIELLDKEPTTSHLLEDVLSNVPTEETRSSSVSFDMSVSLDGSVEQTLTPLKTSPLVVMAHSLTTTSLLPIDTSAESTEDFVPFGPSTSDSSSGFQLSTTPEEVELSTSAPNFENEGSAENSIVILEDEGSGAVTPGFLNATDQPIQTTNIISEIDSTANGVSLPFSLPVTSTSEAFHTYDGTPTSSVENTSTRRVSLNEQELANDLFTPISFSETTNPSPLSSSSGTSIALTSTTSEILSTENPSSQLPVSVSAGLQSTLESPTSLPSLAPDVPSSQSPIFDVVTVSLKPPPAYNMIASSTGVWNNLSSEGSASPLGSSSSTYSPSTSTTEINTPSISTYSTNSFPVTFGASLTPPISITSSEFLPSTTSRPATLPSFSSSTMAVSTASPDVVPSTSTNSAIVTSISPTAADIPTSTTVPPIINLWNLLIARITTANGIPFLANNVTSISPLSDGVTSALHNEELKGPTTSSIPSTNENSGNSAFVTRPFWLVTRPNGDSPLVLSTSQTFSKESKPTTVAITRTTTNAEPSVRTSTTESSIHSVADLILTRPVWLQGSTKPSKLTTNVGTTTRLSSPRTSSTEGRVSIIITYPYKPSKFNELSALHDVTSESTTSTTTPLPTTLPTDLIVNGNPNVKNCTEHAVHSSISSVTHNVVNKVIFQMNMTADMGNQLNSSFILDKWSEVMNQFLSSQLKAHQEEIQSSAICEAAGDSVLLKSLLCSNQSNSTKEERLPNLVQFIRHLAPAIIANLTKVMNLTEIQNSNVTEFEINHSSTTPSVKETSTESTVPISTESTTMSTLLMQHFTESFLLNLSTASVNNGSVSPLPTLNISLESLMENLTEQLKDTPLTDVISAVNRLSQNIPEGFLENLIQNNNSNSDVFFHHPIKVDSVKEDLATTQEHTSTSSTMIPTTEVHDVLQKDFWKTNRRSPFKMLQRVAGAGRVIPLSIGLSWRGTMKPVSSIFRSFAKPAAIRL